MRTSWQGVLLSVLLVLAGGPAIAKPSAPPAEPSASCPPVVREFLETVGLLPELPDYARPIVLIDVHGHPLDCLPRTLPAHVHAQAAEFLHQSGIVMTYDRPAGPVCFVSEGHLESTAYIGLIVSYDLARMNSPTCLNYARQDLERLKER
jgi:hypothetical protein